MPQWGDSNEYPQHIFSWTNKKNMNYFCLKNKNHIIWSYGTIWCKMRGKNTYVICKEQMPDQSARPYDLIRAYLACQFIVLQPIILDLNVNREGAWLDRLICTFTFHILHMDPFPMLWITLPQMRYQKSIDIFLLLYKTYVLVSHLRI